MYGVLPTYSRLHQLQHWKAVLEERFGKSISILSGGASVTIPLAAGDELPPAINHFRVGESLFLGTDVYRGSIMDDLHQNLFTLHVDVVELHEKPNVPEGGAGYNLAGDKAMFRESHLPESSFRAILNIGLLDIESRHLQPVDKSLRIAGASSDMMVVDIGRNEAGYKVGDRLRFHMDYMGILRLMNSRYIEKRIESKAEARHALLN
jgi:predicted amino acid racemase